MKKMTFLPVLMAALICAAPAASAAPASRILVAYFSVPETSRAENMTDEEENSTVVIDGKVLGNTQYAAQLIAEAVGGSLFRIEPAVPYTTVHADLVDQALKEQRQNARPALKEKVKNMEQYDTVFLGYPNWWGDMPMIIRTFIESHDLRGKRIIPFMTHGGSGLSGTPAKLQEALPGSTVERNALSIYRDDVQSSAREAVTAWLKTLKFVK